MSSFVVSQEGDPPFHSTGVRERPRQVARHRFLGEAEAELREFGMNTRCPPTEQSDGVSLAGTSPRVRFGSDQLVLISSDRSRASVKWGRFFTGDLLMRVAAPGDVLHIVRTPGGQLGLSVCRGETLVLALGSVTSVHLGSSLSVQSPRSDLFVTIRWGSETLELLRRESAEVGGYDVYVERPALDGIPGTGECLSIVQVTNSTVVNAARRAAVLLDTEDFDPIQGERLGGSLSKPTAWDGGSV